jgi:hypothetical protein
MVNKEGLYIARYTDTNGNQIHEIDLPHIDLTDPDLDFDNLDNVCVGCVQDIKVYTTGYLDEGKVECKGVKLPCQGGWQGLSDRYPKGKVLKLREDFYEVTGITVSIATSEFVSNGNLSDRWTDTDRFTAEVNVKPYGTDDDDLSFIFEVDKEILRRWRTSK